MPDTDLCVVCHHNPPDWGAVCDDDLKTMVRQLTDLPRKIRALDLHAIPGQTDRADRVTTHPVHAPLPARLDALSLAGPGNAEAVDEPLHPLRRTWYTERTALISVMVAPGQIETHQQVLRDWHSDWLYDTDGTHTGTPGAVIAAVDSDQVGLIPPGPWLDAWVREWRAQFGHGVPARTFGAGPGWPKTEDAAREDMWRAMLAADPHTSPAAAGMAAEWRRWAARIVLGLDTHTSSGDPLADEYEIRFGPGPRHRAYMADIAYLILWLPTACDRDVGVAGFAAELRALTAELARVLGETPDQTYLGRCPAFITHTEPLDNPDNDDDDGGLVEVVTRRPCGAGLWQDPHASQVCCARCHATWGPATVQKMTLALEIRRVWPVDRRRRYTLTEIDELNDMDRMPWCPGCREHRIAVGWTETTAPDDEHRTWRPAAAACPGNGCPDAAGILH